MLDIAFEAYMNFLEDNYNARFKELDDLWKELEDELDD